MNAERIVVGYDGSAQSRDAVSWAAAEADRTGAMLQVLHAYEFAWPGTFFEGSPPPVEADARRRADRLVAVMVDEVRRLVPGVHVIGTAVHGPPAQKLLEVHGRTRLLVVGSRGTGGFAGLLVGSVSQQVATHARRPVVVVRGRTTAADGPVVVGVDGSDAAQDALAVTFETAAARNAGIVAIRAYARPILPAHAVGTPVVVAPEVVEGERAALTASLARWRDKYPDVGVEVLLAEGRPAEALIGVSATAQLVVVGSRGHGGFAGLLLGSVGQHLLHHADCPVIITHHC